MPFEHTPALIKQYATKKIVRQFCDITVKLYKDLQVHADGLVPERVICERRPNESDRIKDYRAQIYEPITEVGISKVITSLSKIRRSPDWSIQFKPATQTIIVENENLESYLTVNYPNDYTSLTNWTFTVGIKEYLVDSNAVVFVYPLQWEVLPTEYLKPFPFIFNSTQIADYLNNSYCILLAEEKCTYNVVDTNGANVGVKDDGDIYIGVDEVGIYTYNQLDQRKNFILNEAETHIHNLGFMPVFKMPGVFYKTCEKRIVHKSRINAMVAHLNEAARLYSDLQAEYVQHVHSDRWEIMNTKCTHCNGTGQLSMENQDPCACDHCKGSGYVPTSPYTVRVLTPPEIGQEPMPTPPAGYIQKTDVAEMCDRLTQAVDKHKYEALAAINMQTLEQVPISQSGTAKEVDRDEQRNFVHAVAEDIVYIMDKIILITNEYRARGVISDPDKRKELLPNIAVPDRLDLVSAASLSEEVKNAKDQGTNGYVVSVLEKEYVSKKFYNQPEIMEIVDLAFSLDPLLGLNQDDKIAALQNNGATQIDYIISSNLIPFIKRAREENKDFAALDKKIQFAKLVEYATEKEQQISAAGRIAVATAKEEIVEDEPIEDVNTDD